MRRPSLHDLPPLPVMSEGYQLREATSADAEGIARVLERSFEEPWSVDRVREVLLDHPEVPKTFVVEHVGTLVATTSYQIMPREWPTSGWVHYVGADPTHGGKGLGYAVVLAVLHEADRDGKLDSMLTTDDPRLPAIRTYFKLGFEPDMWHESHAERWREVYRALGVPS